MTAAAKITLGVSLATSAAIIGYVHYSQHNDRLRLHDGVLRDIERQQRRKVENTYTLQKQIDLTKQLKNIESEGRLKRTESANRVADTSGKLAEAGNERQIEFSEQVAKAHSEMQIREANEEIRLARLLKSTTHIPREQEKDEITISKLENELEIRLASIAGESEAQQESKGSISSKQRNKMIQKIMGIETNEDETSELVVTE